VRKPTFLNFSIGAGAPALAAGDATVRVSGDSSSLVRGGHAGCCGTSFGAQPGVGIATTGASTVDAHSVPVQGGNNCNGTPGPATSGTGITLNAPALPVLRVTGTLTLTGNAMISFTNGPPGASFLIAISESHGFASAGPSLLGEILIDPVNWFLLLSGNLSPAGSFVVNVPLTGIAPSFAYTPVYLQGIALDPSGAFWRVSNSTEATLRP
jgi:hypothetical protein